MPFLIGVIILILFIVVAFFYIRNYFRKLANKYLGTTNVKEILEQAQIEDEELPKSLSSMDSLYLEQIKRDFPELNINELKRSCEKEILLVYRAIENKNSTGIKNAHIKAFVDKEISELGNESVKYNDFKIHRTVVSKYEKSAGVATIYFATAFQYIYVKSDGNRKKVQNRVRSEYIYVIDASKVDNSKKNLGINCPNCGAPIRDLGKKRCSYCNSYTFDIVNKCWVCNDLELY